MSSCPAPALVNLNHVPAQCKAMQLVMHLHCAWVPDCRCKFGVGAPISTGKLRTSLSRTARPALHLPIARAGAQFVTGIIVPCAHQTCIVSAALGELRHGLRDALMLELSPGEAFYQESSVVLLRGKLLMTGRADTVPLQQLPG